MSDEGSLNLNGSLNDDIDIPLMNMGEEEEEVTKEPPKPAPVPPKRGRGRPRTSNKPKDLDAEDPIPAPIPQIASVATKKVFGLAQQQANMANLDLDELFNRYDWESGAYSIEISRIQPKAFHGSNCEGFVETARDRIDEAYIKSKHGGGTYDIKVKGPDARTGAQKTFLGGRRIHVNGDPIIDIENMRQHRESRGFFDTPPKDPAGRKDGANEDMVKLSFDTITSELSKKSEEAEKLQKRLLESAAKPNGNGGSTDRMLELIKEQSEKAISAERSSRRDFEQIMGLVSSQRGGIPPELLQSLTEQHRAEVNAVTEAHKSQTFQERQTHQRELDAVRERFERELATVRSEMQARIDREREMGKRETDRDRESFDRRLEMVTNDGKRERQDLANQHKMERDFMANQHQMQVENIKSIHAGQITTLETQHKATLEMQKSAYESRIESLKGELDRLRNEVTSLQAKTQDQGDFVSQAKKLRDFSESLKGVFSPDATLALPDADELEDDEPPKGIIGGLWKLAQTDFGKNMFATLINAATGMPPVQPGMPGQPMVPPGAPYMAQQPYGQPSGYPAQQAQHEAYEEEPFEEEEEEPQAAQGQESSSSPPAEPKPVAATLTPEALEQIGMIIKGLEASMEGDEEPAKVAQILSSLPQKDQLNQFVTIPTDGFIEQIRQVAPSSSLLSFGGRQYIAKLQKELSSSIQ